MPLYTFKDTETGETFDMMMKMAEKDVFLENNPQLQSVIGAPMIVSGVMGQRKVDEGFSEVLQKIGEQNPNTPFGREVGAKATTAKQGKVNQVVEKWQKKFQKDMNSGT
jgi:hypothetical protein